MSILIVDDCEMSGKILEANLQKLNYETIVAVMEKKPWNV